MGSPTDTLGQTGLRRVMNAPDFRRMLVAFAISRAGDLVYNVALLVVVLRRSGDPAYVGALVALRFLPYVVIGPLAGALADRVNRVLLMVASDLARLSCMLLLAVLVATNAAPELLIAAAVLSGCAGSAYQPSFTATLPATLPEDQLAQGNALISVVEYVAIIAGPSIGAALLSTGHDVVPFLVNAATFLLSAAILFRLRGRHRAPEAQPGPRPSLGRDLLDGVAELRSDRNLAVLCTVLTVLAGLAGVESVYLILASNQFLGLGTSGVGVLDAAFGLGGVLAAGLAAVLARRGRPLVVLAGVVLLCAVPMATLSFIRVAVLGLAVLFVGGAASVTLDVVAVTTLQRVVAPDRMSRCDGLLSALAYIGVITGSIVAPIVLSLVGLQSALLLGSLVPAGIALAALMLGARVDDTAAAAAELLAPRVAALRSTPVFAAVPQAALERLAALAEEVTFPPGTDVLVEGAPPDDLYVLITGTCTATVTRGGAGRTLNDLTAPDVVGEIGLLNGSPRSATVTTTSTCTMLRVPGALFLDTVLSRPLTSALVDLTEGRLARSGAVR